MIACVIQNIFECIIDVLLTFEEYINQLLEWKVLSLIIYKGLSVNPVRHNLGEYSYHGLLRIHFLIFRNQDIVGGAGI